ncbi:MAG: beta-lactamase family protein [Lentisphaeraceae bacterium]|nr:beta-lactamase family protein [Lentisphaeraceae bacterium]
MKAFLVLLTFFTSWSFANELPEATPESVGVSSQTVLEFVEALENEIDAVHSFVLVKNGKVISKGWWNPYQNSESHMLYSLSKSFTSTAIGMACDEGLLNLSDKVISFFPKSLPEKVSENLKAMTIKDLLIMGTGHSVDTLKPIINEGDDDWVKVFLAQEVTHKPGGYFKYNTGATYMLSKILTKVTKQTLVQYLEPRLFKPLGIRDYSWEVDPIGANTGGYGLKINTMSIAKFGQFYLQEGLWNGKQLISREWIKKASSKQIENGTNPKSDWNQGYGFQFWRCQNNSYRADGAFGQYCIVMPDKQTVLAVNGGMKGMQKLLNIVWTKLYPKLGSKPLPLNITANETLKAKLKSLSLKPLSLDGSFAEKENKVYKFADNDKGLRSFSFKKMSDGTNKILLTNEHGTQEVKFSSGKWTLGEMTFEKNIKSVVGRTNGLQKIASSGGWVNKDHLKVKVFLVETPYCLTFDFKFDGDKVELVVNYNVYHGPTTWSVKGQY